MKNKKKIVIVTIVIITALIGLLALLDWFFGKYNFTFKSPVQSPIKIEKRLK